MRKASASALQAADSPTGPSCGAEIGGARLWAESDDDAACTATAAAPTATGAASTDAAAAAAVSVGAIGTTSFSTGCGFGLARCWSLPAEVSACAPTALPTVGGTTRSVSSVRGRSISLSALGDRGGDGARSGDEGGEKALWWPRAGSGKTPAPHVSSLSCEPCSRRNKSHCPVSATAPPTFVLLLPERTHATKAAAEAARPWSPSLATSSEAEFAICFASEVGCLSTADDQHFSEVRAATSLVSAAASGGADSGAGGCGCIAGVAE
mmetsp:Transcript_75969/g.217602  ORF Transcript_75969/g.217602 Transcript_75969/m.217602 type:complete len:267 (-) Transcript_75969:68-868(-)